MGVSVRAKPEYILTLVERGFTRKSCLRQTCSIRRLCHSNRTVMVWDSLSPPHEANNPTERIERIVSKYFIIFNIWL